MMPLFTIIPFLSALLASAILMPICIRMAFTLDIVDRPTHRKIHLKPTPYLGGFGLVAAICLTLPVMYFFPVDGAPSIDFIRMSLLLIPCLAACVIGVLDDKFTIRARVKLLVQILLAVSCAGFYNHVATVLIPGWGTEDLNDLGIPVTIAWMLGVINGINFVDGVDGLSGTVTAVIYAGIAWLAINVNSAAGLAPNPDWVVACLALAGCGATLGFLIFNWRPAKIYMGESGSLASGTLISVLMLCVGSKLKLMDQAYLNPPSEAFPYHFALVSLLATYPLMEISLTIIRRYLAGKPVFSADKGHIHHRLMKRGWSAQMVCMAAAVISLLSFGIVVGVRLHFHGVAVWLLLGQGVLAVLMLHFCGFLEMFHPRSIQGNRPHFLIANHFMSMQLIKLDHVRNVDDVLELTNQTCVEFGVERYAITLSKPAQTCDSAEDRGEKFEWQKPASAHGFLLLAADPNLNGSGELKSFSDKIELPDGLGATWTFEPHVIEDEIDVEYRVLVSDYMKKALRRTQALSAIRTENQKTNKSVGSTVTSVSSTALRRKDTLTIKEALPPAAVQEKKEK